MHAFSRCRRNGVRPEGSDTSSDLRFTKLQQPDVAARRRDVGAAHALGGAPRKVVRPAGFGSGAGGAIATEGVHADHGSDLVAVDVEVADAGPLGNQIRNTGNAAVQA